MIQHVSHSAQVSYKWSQDFVSKRECYCLTVETGRELLSLEERSVPQIGRIPELTKTYQVAFRAYVRTGPEPASLREEAALQLSEARLAIERELAKYMPIPEFLTFQYKGRYYAVLNNHLWSCIRGLTEEQWRVLISQTLAREEAKLAAWLTGRHRKQSERELIPESVGPRSGGATKVSVFVAVHENDWNLIT